MLGLKEGVLYDYVKHLQIMKLSWNDTSEPQEDPQSDADACDDLPFAVGFRTVPMMALKIPNPWNAQSLSYAAKPLRMFLSPHSTIITSTTKRMCFHALLMMMFTHGQIDQCLYMYCPPSADKWKTQGSLILSSRLLTLFLTPFCAWQADTKLSILHRQAPPRSWLQAVEAFICCYEETNLCM